MGGNFLRHRASLTLQSDQVTGFISEESFFDSRLTQPTMQYVPRALFGWGLKLSTYAHLEPRLRTRDSLASFLRMASWRAQGPLYLGGGGCSQWSYPPVYMYSHYHILAAGTPNIKQPADLQNITIFNQL